MLAGSMLPKSSPGCSQRDGWGGMGGGRRAGSGPSHAQHVPGAALAIGRTRFWAPAQLRRCKSEVRCSEHDMCLFARGSVVNTYLYRRLSLRTRTVTGAPHLLKTTRALGSVSAVRSLSGSEHPQGAQLRRALIPGWLNPTEAARCGRLGAGEREGRGDAAARAGREDSASSCGRGARGSAARPGAEGWERRAPARIPI
eukprot:scaffold7998_cov417-Prasinococcus_capsulatus_cf.AAC.15